MQSKRAGGSGRAENGNRVGFTRLRQTMAPQNGTETGWEREGVLLACRTTEAREIAKGSGRGSERQVKERMDGQ